MTAAHGEGPTGPAAGSPERQGAEPCELAENGPEISYRSHGTNSSDAGRFRSQQSEAERFWSKVTTTPEGCWVWHGQTNTWGYGHFRRTLAPGLYRTVK